MPMKFKVTKCSFKIIPKNKEDKFDYYKLE